MEECERWLEQLSAQMDGELSPEEERELEQHLAQCPACRALAEQLAGLSAGLRDMEEVPAPDGFAQGVMERIAGEKKVVPLFRRPQFRAFAGLAACAVLCIGLYQSGLLDRQTGNADAVDMVQSTVSAAIPAEKGGEDVQPQISTYSAEDLSPHVDVSLAGADGLQSRGTDAEAEYTVLTLASLPEGAEDILGQEVQWTRDEAGNLRCPVEAEQLEALEDLAQEQGITAARSVGEESGGLCTVVLLSQ